MTDFNGQLNEFYVILVLTTIAGKKKRNYVLLVI